MSEEIKGENSQWNLDKDVENSHYSFTAKIKGNFQDIRALVKGDDDCVHLWIDDPQDDEQIYLHLCELNDFINTLQALKDFREKYFAQKDLEAKWGIYD